MDEAVLEREAVDERFQRRSRRAHGAGHIDLPGAPVVEIIRRADPRQHVAARIVHRDDRHRNIRPERDGAVARQAPPAPSAGSESSVSEITGASLTVATARSAECGARIGIGLRIRGTGTRFGLSAHPLPDTAPSSTMRSSTRSRATRAAIRIAIEAAVFRRLRQRHQQRRFRQRQPLRLLAEIGDRGGANALEIAAIGRQRQIQIEDLILVQLPLEFDRADDLAQLGMNRPLPPRLHQPGQLHGDGRAAGYDVTAGDELKRGAAQCQRIDAAVGTETPVFIGQQQLEIGRDRRRFWHRPAAASGRRPSHRRATACRCGRRPWSRPARACASGSGPSETTHAAKPPSQHQADRGRRPPPPA